MLDNGFCQGVLESCMGIVSAGNNDVYRYNAEGLGRAPGAAVPESMTNESKEGTGDTDEIVAILEDMKSYVE